MKRLYSHSSFSLGPNEKQECCICCCCGEDCWKMYQQRLHQLPSKEATKPAHVGNTYLHILPYLGDCGHRANETKSRPRVGQSVAARGAVEWKCKWLQKHKYFRRWQVLSHIATRQFAQSVCGSKLNVIQQQSWGEMDGWLWPLCWNRLMEMQWRGFNGKLNSSLDISAFLLGLEDSFYSYYLWITGHWVHANISKSRFDGKSKDKKIPRTFSGHSESKETNRRGLNNKTNP